MKDILIFCPSIEYGGVEKNLFITSNYLAKKSLNKKIYLISANNDQKKKFSRQRYRLFGSYSPISNRRDRVDV